MYSDKSIRESNLGFLQKPPPPSIRATMQKNSNFTDEIFLKGINTSHIGYISGNRKQIEELDF